VNISTQLLITTISKTTHSISIFALSIILSRYFTKDDYGTYLHVQLIVNFATWAFLLGLPHSVYYFLPRVAEQKKFIFMTLSVIVIISLSTSLLVFYNASSLSSLLSNPALIDLAYIIGLMVLFQIPLSLFEPLMITVGKIKEFSQVEIFFNLGLFALISAAVLFNADVSEILMLTAVLYSLRNAVLIYYASKIALSYIKDQVGEAYSFKQQLDYSLPIGLSMGVMELSRYTDRIIVSNQTNPEDFAVYTRGAMEIPVVSILANTLDNLMMPKFVESYKNKRTDEILHSWHSMIRLMAVFIYPCCLFLITSASLLIPALFSDKYIGSIIIFQIYTLGLLTRISTFNVIMRAIGKTKIILWISLFSILLNIYLTITLMELWGLLGAPIATVVTTAMMRYAYLIGITYYLKVKMLQVIPWQALAHSLLASVIASLPVIFLLDADINIWVNLLVMAIIYSTIYISLIRKNQSLTIQEKGLIKDYLPTRLKWLIA